MENVLNVGVVGCGYWGPNLIRNFNALPESSVKMVCDKDHERLDHVKGLYPDVDTTSDFDGFINNPNDWIM